ncbi:Uncharacterised protein [Sebaldella termitidis]|uniref:Uncharacterized protein n=1 Tax=Sebaldella termitidis (strain ATCC 33386 / NCTC 11300) TaxID=526218 RepID=D1AGN6_SEBTE|nr:hypothetical protein [Sebaldella termitidis]ACZ10756.1 conserved hypothetical protein [Sebaldella termitidis ATCC 33386]SUI26099.1 Uncharacterised protein [Sebaldella termitidis]
MARYIVNKNPDDNGTYVIHKKHECNHLPSPENQIKLGDYSSPANALFDARRTYDDKVFDSCKYCCPECHTE